MCSATRRGAENITTTGLGHAVQLMLVMSHHACMYLRTTSGSAITGLSSGLFEQKIKNIT